MRDESCHRFECFLRIDRQNWKKPYQRSHVPAEKYQRMNFNFSVLTFSNRGVPPRVEGPAAYKGGHSFVANGRCANSMTIVVLANVLCRLDDSYDAAYRI
jgi:hypothetical protein